MKYNRTAAAAFLDGGDDFDRDRAASFLEGQTGLKIPGDQPLPEKTLPSEFQIPGGFEPDMNQAMTERYGVAPESTQEPPQEKQPAPDRSFAQAASDYPAAFNQEIFKLIGLPGDLWDLGMKVAGLDQVIGLSGAGSDATTELGAKLGVSYRKGEEPDTVGTKMGQYTALGLEFLAPFIRMGRAGMSASAIKAETEIQIPFINKAFTTSKVNALSPAAAGSGMAYKQTSVLEGMSQSIAAPFQQGPKLALAGEFAASAGAGVGAYYGEQGYGSTGEMIGGLIGGPMAQLSLMGGPRLAALGKKQLFPYTEPGGKMKAGDRIRSLAETNRVAENIDKGVAETLPGSNIPPAKLSGDRHLIALQNRVLKDDPVLSREFALEETRINTMAREELKRVGSNVPIEETQTYLKGRIDRISTLMDRRVDMALRNAMEANESLTPQMRRKVIHTEVNKEVTQALTEERSVESAAWDKVGLQVRTKTSDTMTAYKNILAERSVTSDPDEIPAFIETFLGRVEKGKFEAGSLGETQTVKTLQHLRSRILHSMRAEKAIDAPNWNKVRILDNLQEGILTDMGKPKSAGIEEAIAISSKLNDKFKGGIMNTIFGNEKTGGKIAPEISLETINSGPKAAVEIKRVLDASPESFGKMEDLIKLKVASKSAGIIKDGRMNADKAKKYMERNEDVFDLFPDLKKQMDKAIGLEERAIGMSKRAKVRQGQLAISSAAKLSQIKPGRVFKSILESPYPEREAQKIWSQSNARGKRGLLNDAIDYLIKTSRGGGFDESEISQPLLSGRKLSFEWDNNKGVYNQIFNQGERKRIAVIMNTLKKNETLGHMPQPLDNVVDPGNKVIRWILGVQATRFGAGLGAGTSGAALKTASMASRVSNDIVDKLDTSTATRLIKDAIQDPELFKALMADTTKAPDLSRAWKVLQGWMVGVAVDSLEEKTTKE